MKKYILKRDLPLAKAGTIFQVDLGKSDPKIYENKERNFKIIGVVDRDTMDEWLEEIPEKPKSVWDLKKGDIYYSLDMYSVSKYCWIGDIIDVNKRDAGFCFLTQKEAHKELKKIKAIQKIKKYCWENGIKTEYEFGKNDVVFYLRRGDVVFIGDFQNGNPLGYFSHENAQTILDNFEEELKIILN